MPINLESPLTRYLDDSWLQISAGLVAGISHVNKFGENAVIASNATGVIWDGMGTSYPFPATALIVKISQTTNQADLLAAPIEIQGLDANWAAVTQVVNLSAADTTTPVVLTTPLKRVFRMKVLANVVTTSPVRCHNAAEDVDYAIIQTGNNQTLMAIYTVPAGKTAYVRSYYGDVVPTTSKEPLGTRFTLWVADRANSYEFQIKHAKGVPQYASGFQHYFGPYMKVTEKSDIMMKATCLAEEGYVHGGFDLILVDN